MTIYALPERFVRYTTDLFGDQGKAWLAQLPNHLARLEERWEMRLELPFDLT
jgi:hypothetical protein